MIAAPGDKWKSLESPIVEIITNSPPCIFSRTKINKLHRQTSAGKCSKNSVKAEADLKQLRVNNKRHQVTKEMAPIATTNDPKLAQAGENALNHRSDASYYNNHKNGLNEGKHLPKQLRSGK